MIIIKILDTGCPKCKKTSRVEEVVKELGVEATVEKVEDIMEIMKPLVKSAIKEERKDHNIYNSTLEFELQEENCTETKLYNE